MDGDLQVSWGEAVGELLEAFGVRTLHEGVGGLPEKDAFTLELARQPFMLVDAHACVERKVRADAQEHATPVLIAQIEVVLPHEARADLNAVATSGRGVADGDPSVLAALEDDRDAEARAEALIERLDPVFSPYAFGRLDDLYALSCCQMTYEAVVVLRDLAKVCLGN